MIVESQSGSCVLLISLYIQKQSKFYKDQTFETCMSAYLVDEIFDQWKQ